MRLSDADATDIWFSSKEVLTFMHAVLLWENPSCYGCMRDSIVADE